MKKIFVCAMAAIVALASCSKTELINTEAPKEIGFKAVTGSHTKAEESGTLNVNTKLGVIAYVNGTSNLYFENTAFSKETINTVNYWTGNKFWPLDDKLDFIVYAPFDSNTSLDNTNKKKITVTASNTGCSDIAAQTDYLYGAAFYNGDSNSGYDKNTTAVTTELNHALAKITVSLTASNVTINEVKLVGATMSGTYSVDYTGTPAPDWSPANTTENFVFATLKNIASTTATVATAAESIMVVPKTEATSIIIDYTLNNASTNLTAEVDLNTSDDEDNPTMWIHGTHYTYQITISPQGIKFATPQVNPWTEVPGSPTTLD